MTCKEAENLVTPYIRHELEDDQLMEEFLDHIDSCENCREELEIYYTVEAGILDPAKVTRSALQNACSVASTLLTTESVVANIKEDTPAMPAGGPGMGGMM